MDVEKKSVYVCSSDPSSEHRLEGGGEKRKKRECLEANNVGEGALLGSEQAALSLLRRLCHMSDVSTGSLYHGFHVWMMAFSCISMIFSSNSTSGEFLPSVI